MEYSQLNSLFYDKTHGGKIESRSTTGDTPLHLATFAGHDLIVRMLLARGADKYARSTDGITPMDLAQAGSPVFYLLNDGSK